MPFNWQWELQKIQTQIIGAEKLFQKGDYHHSVIYFDGELPASFEENTPRICNSFARVAKKYTIPLPGGGYHIHFIFDLDISNSDDSGIDVLQNIVSNALKILSAMPNKKFPRIDVPSQNDGLSENLIAWLYLLHWMGHFPKNSVFRSEYEYLENITDLENSTPFIPWKKLSTLPDFSPVRLLTETSSASSQFSDWNTKHIQVGKRIPSVIASNLTKPIIYASKNATPALIQTFSETQPRKGKAAKERSHGKSSEMGNYLLVVLMEHHKFEEDKKYYVPLKQEEIALKLDRKQGSVSKYFRELFGGLESCRGQSAMSYYKKECQNGTIIGILAKLNMERLMPKPMRERIISDLNSNFNNNDDLHS